KQFDYQPNRAKPATAMQEGFAEWLRMRETDQLTGLTRDQQKAAAYAENALASKSGVIEKLDRIREQFRQLGAQSGAEQFGGLISKTGKPAQPDVTAGEATTDYLQKT